MCILRAGLLEVSWVLLLSLSMMLWAFPMMESVWVVLEDSESWVRQDQKVHFELWDLELFLCLSCLVLA